MTQRLEALSFWTPVSYPCSVDDPDDLSTKQWLINKVDNFFHICGHIAIPTPQDDIRSLKGSVSVVLSEGVYLMDDEETWLGTALKILAYITVVIPLIMLLVKVVLRCTYNYHVVSSQTVFDRRDRARALEEAKRQRAFAAQQPRREDKPTMTKPISTAATMVAEERKQQPAPRVESRSAAPATAPQGGAGAASLSSSTSSQAVDPRIAQWATKYGFDQNKKFTSHLWLGGEGVTVLESLTLLQAFTWMLNYIKGKTVVKLDHQTVETEIFNRRPHDQSKTSHRQLTPQEVEEMRQRTEMERTMTEILIYQNTSKYKTQDFTNDAFRQETRGADTLDMLEFVLRVLNRERVIAHLKEGKMRGEWAFTVPKVGV